MNQDGQCTTASMRLVTCHGPRHTGADGCSPSATDATTHETLRTFIDRAAAS